MRDARREFYMANALLAISNHATFMGGGEHSFVDLISHLPGEYPVVASIPSEDALAKRIRERNIFTVINPLPPIRPTCIHQIVKTILQFRRLCRKRNIRLIYANGSRAAFYGGIVGRMSAIPVIWHCRISEPDPCLDGILVRLAGRVIANSKATALRFSPRFQKKIETVYNGFDLKWLKEEDVKRPNWIDRDWSVILVVARASRWKRHDLILQAFEKVACSEKSVRLVCAGEKDHSEPAWWDELQERTRKSFASERIHWCGAVDDVRPWYRAALMMVLPSVHEPFGRVVIEAMALGVPVIATRSGGIPEIITHMQNGMLVPENDADAIAEAVMNMLHDDLLRKRIIEQGLRRAEDFSIESHVEKMANIFSRLIKNCNGFACM